MSIEYSLGFFHLINDLGIQMDTNRYNIFIEKMKIKSYYDNIFRQIREIQNILYKNPVIHRAHYKCKYGTFETVIERSSAFLFLIGIIYVPIEIVQKFDERLGKNKIDELLATTFKNGIVRKILSLKHVGYQFDYGYTDDYIYGSCDIKSSYKNRIFVIRIINEAIKMLESTCEYLNKFPTIKHVLIENINCDEVGYDDIMKRLYNNNPGSDLYSISISGRAVSDPIMPYQFNRTSNRPSDYYRMMRMKRK